MEFRISQHAREEMARRDIPEDIVLRVLREPEQIVSGHEGRKAYQSRIEFGGGKVYLVRVILIDSVEPAIVVTVYRTSKIEKYWEAP